MKEMLRIDGSTVLLDRETKDTVTLKEALEISALSIFDYTSEYSKADSLEERQKIQEKLNTLCSSSFHMANIYKSIKD